MQTNSNHLINFGLIILAIFTFGCAATSSVNPKFDVAPDEYSELSEKYLMLLARM